MHDVCQHHAGMVSDISAVRREIDDLKASLKENSRLLNEIALKLNKFCLLLERMEEKLTSREDDQQNIAEKVDKLEEFRDQLLGAISLIKWLAGLGIGTGTVSLIIQFLEFVK